MTEQNNFHESDPIAIVGMGCRVPGATSPSELWTLMETQRDVRRKMPSERFHVDAFYHPNGKNKGTASGLEINLQDCTNKVILRQTPSPGTFWTKTFPSLTRASLMSRARKPRQWILSSGWLWKLYTRRWKTVWITSPGKYLLRLKY